MQRNVAQRAIMATLLAAVPAIGSAQIFPGLPFDPNESDFGASLRCWFHDSSADRPLGTDHIDLPGDLPGKMAAHKGAGKASLFYTDLAPAELKSRCEQALSAKGHFATQLIDWSVKWGQDKYNVAIWYNGDQAPAEPIERVIAFGDSLSDSGNMYNGSEWTFPNHTGWFLGRFSNGPVWTEYFANKAGVPLVNWSIGGAETKKAFGLIDGIDDQIKSFKAYASQARDYDPSRTLFTVLVGANDFMSDGRDDINHPIEVAKRIREALTELGNLGAKKILLLNLPDISVTPSFMPAERRHEAILIRDKVRLLNEGMPALAAEVRNATGADVQLFDMAAKFDELLADPARFGMSNYTMACLDLDADSKVDYLLGRDMREGCQPQEYVFWDRVHPTTAVHRLIADWAFATASEAWGIRER